MEVCVLNKSSYEPKINFGHGEKPNTPYPLRDRAIVAATTVLGVAASSAVLAKGAGYSLNPAKMFKNISKSYLAKVDFHAKQIIGIGIGSCLGGLAGGYIVDKDESNRKAKRRETVMQIGNISIPILTVDFLANWGKKFGRVAQAVFAISGIFLGVTIANLLMNQLGNFIFLNKNDARKVKPSDYSAHLDDMVAAASYISSAPLVKKIARLVPVALMVAGNEVGNKKAKHNA